MIEVNGLLKTFAGGDVRAVDDVSFTVAAGTIFTLLGPSGCGKTTTLRSVAGLERPDAGSIRLSDETVFSSEGHVFVHPYRRRIGMVFQSYAIWPHMTVMQNVVYPLKGREFGRKEVQERARKALEMVNLGELGDRPAPALSGGQQQRVALARAIAGDPRILLLDEPLSNLDAKLREEMRGQIRQLQRKLGLTSLYVTHDQVEALSLSDVIAIMDGGKLDRDGHAAGRLPASPKPLRGPVRGPDQRDPGTVARGGRARPRPCRDAVGADAVRRRRGRVVRLGGRRPGIDTAREHSLVPRFGGSR